MKIGYYSYYPSHWKGMARKMAEHHHHIFRIINSEIENIEIYPMVRPQNKSKIRKYNEGDTSILVDGFQNIKFNFVEDEDMSYISELDGLFLEPGRVFVMDEVFGAKNDRIENARKFLYMKVKEAIKLNLPILFYDGDADLMSDYNSGNYAKQLFVDLDLNNYNKCTVIGPYEDCKGKINNFKFVPYNIDFNTLPNEDEIKDATNRNIISTYFGSNYHRNSFIPYFNNVSKYGTMRVFGSSWNPKKMLNVELNKAIWLAEGEFNKYYDESLFGLYGDNDLTGDYKHYTLRIAEYLKAGIFIVPDEKDYLLNKFPDNTVSITGLYEDYIKYLRLHYVDLVINQRNKLKETFDSRNYVNIYYKSLSGKE